jgi:NADPH:quinone reductase-like Zn-dependent oxidoreductase
MIGTKPRLEQRQMAVNRFRDRSTIACARNAATRQRGLRCGFGYSGRRYPLPTLSALGPGGKLISIVGPPDPDLAKQIGATWILGLAMRALSHRIRKEARRHGVSYSFLFMRPSGDQLREIGTLIDSGAIRPVVDRVFPFEATNEALKYVEKGRSKGKVIVKMR